MLRKGGKKTQGMQGILQYVCDSYDYPFTEQYLSSRYQNARPHRFVLYCPLSSTQLGGRD